MTLNVPDISRYQDTSIIPALRAGGTDAIIVGVTFGCAGSNPIYAAQLDATAANGMLRGAYHIRARVNWSPQEEADFFIAHMAGYLDGRTILILDWEECDTSDEAWALAWLQYVQAKTGIKPWFYVNLSDLTTYRYPNIAAAGFAIWLAQYPYSTVNGYAGVNWAPQPIPAGHTLVAWQYVGTGGTVNGVSQLDLSVAYLNAAGWVAYATPGLVTEAGTITPITPPEEPDMKAILATDGTSPDVWIGDGITRRKIATLDTLNAVTYLKDLFGLDTTVQTVPDLWALGYPVDQGIESNAADINTNIKGVPLAVLEATFAVGAGGKANVAGALGQLLSTPVAVPAGSTVDVAALAAKLSAILPPAIVSALAAKLSQP